MRIDSKALKEWLKATEGKKKFLGLDGTTTYERLPGGLLLVNRTTYVCATNGGSPMDFRG